MRTFGSKALFLLFIAMLAVGGGTAHAQVAPTGAHYGGRVTDTGHGGATSAGGYAAAVPLDLPTPRGGIPVPLQITYGRRGVGAAGVGWDIPLSYVQRSSSIARRRPLSGEATAQGFDRLLLVMGGREITMVPDGNAWVAHQDAPQLRMTMVPPSQQWWTESWSLQDGEGLTWWFVQPEKLAGSDIWLLDSITAPAAGNAVTFHYELEQQPLAGGGAGLSIDLTRIEYDVHPEDGCRKHDVSLTYSAPAATPLSLAFVNDVPVVRMRTVTEVTVAARASCFPDDLQTVRAYELEYAPDGDTGMPRLAEVRLRGRDDASDPTPMTMPLQRFEYATATSTVLGLRSLRYTQATDVVMPAGEVGELSSTYRDNDVSIPGGNGYATWQGLTDVTGDGRPDLVFRNNDDLWVALNRPASSSGGVTLGANAGLVPLGDATFDNGPLHTRASPHQRFDYSRGEVNPDEVWRQAIDFNGDGRLDVIDAAEVADQWVVYVNKPGNTASGVTWERWEIAVYPLRQMLEARGFEVDPDFIPLSRRVSGKSQQFEMCWYSNGDGTYELTSLSCGEPNPETGYDGTDSWLPISNWLEETHTEWELQDVNGDGYPDFVFGGPTPMGGPYMTPSSNVWPPQGAIVEGTATYAFGWQGATTTTIEVAFNAAGVRFAHSVWPFTAPVSWAPAGACGVSAWIETQDAEGVMVERCANVDVNGDGMLDRIVDARAHLGNGYSLSGVSLDLPGALTDGAHARISRQASDHKFICETTPAPPGYTSYGSWIRNALRDVSGDGIPDFIQGNRVSLGTGFGFAPPVPVSMPAGASFTLSASEEQCNGSDAWTYAGLYDIDADGKPDVVRADPNGTLQVYQLRGSGAARAADAGRLTFIDNGYGALTRIGWRSAKDDGTTAHQVPFAEPVVDSVQTAGKLGLGGTTVATRYAYGDLRMIFDPRRDAWVSAGYGRTVALTIDVPTKGTKGPGMATVTDTLPLQPFSTALTAEQRFGRYALAGRVRDEWTLSGTFSSDPWSLLTADMSVDSRRIAGVHHEWSARATAPWPAQSPDDDCMDVPDPYDWAWSLLGAQTSNGLYFCHAHGFTYTKSTLQWHGDQAPPSQQHVASRSEVTQIDDYGRVTRRMDHNDTHRSDDDLCVETDYAVSQWASARVLGAVSERRLTDCKLATTLAVERYRYDDEPAGTVALGRPTAQEVERRDADTGALLETISVFEATYDDAGNPVEATSTRAPDGAQRKVALTYDPFGLAPIAVHTEADSAMAQDTSEVLDDLTLASLASTDANGTVRARKLDRFGRVLRQYAAQPGNPLGVTVATTYLGFAGSDPLGRRVRTQTLGDPWPELALAIAPGQVVTTFLDEVGRTRRVEVELGSDYGDVLTQGQTYDGFGRPSFRSDLHPTSQAETTSYGTTHHYNPDGSPRCSVRGHGPQAYSNVTKESLERYPTCYERTFANYTETRGLRAPDSLLASSAQAGVVRSTTFTAIARELSRQTYKANVLVEYADYAYDQLGNTKQLRRYKSPANLTDPVTWLTHFDSLGQQLRVDEPESATRYFTYSSFGELLEVQWNDAGHDRRITREYDGLGRLLRSADQANGAEIPETIHSYFYDDAPAPVPEAGAEYQIGRLARTESVTGDDWFGYDAWGNRNSHTAFDASGQSYVERTHRHGDGRLSNIDLYLPDTNFDLETVTYTHDSGQRLRKVTYSGPNDSALIYEATDIDAWGRVRSAHYGNAVTYKADYADLGRRLPLQTEVVSPQGTRLLEHLGWDPVGRERSRRDVTDWDPAGDKTNLHYDALGRISKTARSNSVAITSSAQFAHDALGNTVSLADGVVNSADAELSYRTVDRDRICRIDYGGVSGTGCNVAHDGVGNITFMPTRNGYRELEWFPSGQVRVVKDGTATATFRYDAFGQVAELDLEGAGLHEERHDRRFGNLIERREQWTSGSMKSFIVRNIPGDHGLVAMRGGAGGDWIFMHGEQRGTRWFTDEDGNFVQDVDYRPYGEATHDNSQPQSPWYNWQWNGGDALAPFEISHLGARLYDPVIGRFLSRDPMQVQRTAATSNPYGFALGDPWNRSDPSGLDVGCTPDGQCGNGQILDWLFIQSHYVPTPSGTYGRPRVEPSPFGPPGSNNPWSPAYDMTFDPNHDLHELTLVEGAVYVAALVNTMASMNRKNGGFGQGDVRPAKLAAAVEVIKHRAAEARSRAGGGSTTATPPGEGARRVFLHNGSDAPMWRAVASATPPLFGERFVEVWGHGSQSSMFYSEDAASVEEVGALLDLAGHQKGEPIALVACNVGADLAKAAQQIANDRRSLVVASTSYVFARAGSDGRYYPVVAPMGWSFWWPEKR